MADGDNTYQTTDAVGTSTISIFTPSVSRVRSAARANNCHTVSREHAATITPAGDERAPLLGSGPHRVKKKWYRPRPLWLVPFSITASIVRGMTLGPRVEVFTQLSCNAIYGRDVYDHTGANDSVLLTTTYQYNPLMDIDSSGNHLSRLPVDLTSITQEQPIYFASNTSDDDDDEPDPRVIPSRRCLQDPAVQSGAARLQMIMTFTMGVLSALTTGWWGHFGELHGRTRVLSAATLGLLLTDLMFILVSTPHSIFAAHGHKLLIISPAIEGLLGGWQTLQAAINAYVSDCTSDGSRAQIFSRFTGVSFFGLSIGPTIGAFLIRHPLFMGAPPSSSTHGQTQTVTLVFYVSAFCSFINLLFALFVFPEPPKKEGAIAQHTEELSDADGLASTAGGKHGLVSGFLGPFALLAPRTIHSVSGATKKDWRLTWMASALLVYALSTGIFQIKYLYAEHIYGWGAEQLSYYISTMGAARTLYLLVLMPLIVVSLKPKPKASVMPTAPAVPGKKPPQTPAQIAAEMRFDFALLRASLAVDMFSHILVSLSSPDSSAAMFYLYTSLSSFGAGVDPALHSLALCVMQANGDDNRGKLFGLFAMLRTVGQMILGPLLFGLVYSSTVATYPKAIFVAAGSFAFTAMVFLCMIRPDVGHKGRRRASRRHDDVEPERGRSRISKDISKASVRVVVVPIASGSYGMVSERGSR
ncbi:MFS general substrate transporter [Laetiporus sulphureus 93-53]|uniref:MFS general substrate transporter n=1 Tax=Laetiporus sulphureus 93-53 TaxID=1314785 RepID=A0A165E2Z5_9APHY|nr:MFS general substrate transporter [Laetiporus sulphureus 93-53]KZT06143.1 MFS general substrate transporter [Laetiporus sulphureus 93-53]